MDPKKRWMCLARQGAGWQLEVPVPVGPVYTLLDRLMAAADGKVALGVDFPIGLPRAYVERHCERVPGFVAFLRGLDGQADFFRVAGALDQVGAGRPFYPQTGRAGMTRAAHAAALGLADARALCRACDLATPTRPAGAPLFWTLGANQSGKAAIAAWRDLLIPGLNSAHPPALWPFDGAFRGLLAPGRVAIAETYPAEAMRHLGVKLRGSKRRQADRAGCATAISAAMARLRATGSPAFLVALAHGFGADAAGEDRFDSVLGVLCVIAVLDGWRPDAAPADRWLLEWEGWVLGQTFKPGESDPPPPGVECGA